VNRTKIRYEQDFSKGPTPNVRDLKWPTKNCYCPTTEQEWKSQFEDMRKEWEESSDCATFEAQMIELRQANGNVPVIAVVGIGIGSSHLYGISQSTVSTRI
jgi:hypothetical protein